MLRNRGWRWENHDVGWWIGHFGRRGVALMFFGSLWILIGAGLIVTPQQRFSRDGLDGELQFLDDYTWILGLMWAIGGLLALVGGLIRNRYPRDDYGWIAISAPVFATSALYFWTFWAFVFTAGQSGRIGAWLAGTVYFAVFGFVLFMARWPDPNDPHLRHGAETDEEDAP